MITRGLRVTWAHHAVIKKNHTNVNSGLLVTVLLGCLFTIVQRLEYYNSSFTIADGLYGSCFYTFTGFHGLHVILGTIFLTTILVRSFKGHLVYDHHFGFEAAA